MSMTFRAIDASEDWIFGNGRGSYLKDEAAIEANIKTRLLVFLGEVFFDLNAGVDWWNLMGAKNPAAEANTILQCRTVIINSYGVVRINSVVPTLDRKRALTISYNVDTLFTRNVINSVKVTTTS